MMVCEAEPQTRIEAEYLLKQLFQRNGYVRRLDAERRREEGPKYHKGDEVRLIARDDAELARIRRLLVQADIKPGSPYRKHSRIVQPVYGREAVERFLAWTGQPSEQSNRPKRPRRKRRKGPLPGETVEQAILRGYRSLYEKIMEAEDGS
jgi:hypothetical protein